MNWKEIKGFEGLYEVSDSGLVRNKKMEFLSQQLQNSGYLLVHLYSKNIRKAMLVHRLVAMAFLDDNENLEVDHIDFNKANNNLSNLQFVTKSQNSKKNWTSGRMEKTREAVRKNMSITGTKNKIENGNRLKELNKLLRKPIARIGSCGKIIQTFHSAKEAERLGFRNVRKVLQGKQGTCLGSKFIYI